MTRRRRGGVKRGETPLARNQFPECSPHSRTPRESQSYMERRRGRRETEVTWERKGRVRMGESNQVSNHTPEWKWILKIRFLKVQNW